MSILVCEYNRKTKEITKTYYSAPVNIDYGPLAAIMAEELLELRRKENEAKRYSKSNATGYDQTNGVVNVKMDKTEKKYHA